MHEEQLQEIAEIVISTQTDGIIVSNTTIDRKGLQTDSSKVEQIGNGGLSGAPVLSKSNKALEVIRKALPAEIPVIGVGGIMNEEDGKGKLALGASLIQVYTGFIYGGPRLVRKLSKL